MAALTTYDGTITGIASGSLSFDTDQKLLYTSPLERTIIQTNESVLRITAQGTSNYMVGAGNYVCADTTGSTILASGVSKAFTSASVQYRVNYVTDNITGGKMYINEVTPTIYIDGVQWNWHGNGTPDSSYFYCTNQFTPEQLKRQEFINRIRSLGIVKRTWKGIGRIDESTAEGRARGLLREMIGQEQFSRYIKRGCIEVMGRSGLKYVVYRDTIHVFAKTVTGNLKKVETICLVFKGHEGLPPTDHVIMRKMMIEADEFGMRAIGNKCLRVDNAGLAEVEPAARQVLELKRSA
jgi:hypothetical protein